MRFCCVIFLLLFSRAFCGDIEPGYYPISDPDLSMIYKYQYDADFEFWHHIDGGFEFTNPATKQVEKFDHLSELTDSLTMVKRDLALIWFHKSAVPETKQQELARKLSKDVQKSGFKRVIVLGASGSGVWFLSDTE
ncbi:MAG: hypothetical protein P1V20_13290 [Verrucomicrobiales bacterium]|nr:hypothetical protein [Verrucomicrobiales bacterium]